MEEKIARADYFQAAKPEVPEELKSIGCSLEFTGISNEKFMAEHQAEVDAIMQEALKKVSDLINKSKK